MWSMTVSLRWIGNLNNTNILLLDIMVAITFGGKLTHVRQDAWKP